MSSITTKEVGVSKGLPQSSHFCYSEVNKCHCHPSTIQFSTISLIHLTYIMLSDMIIHFYNDCHLHDQEYCFFITAVSIISTFT